MEFLYAHDHKLIKNGNSYFTTGGFSDEITSRYTDVFGKMTLLCRAIDTKNINGCSRISNSKVVVHPFFLNKILPSKKNFRQINNEINEADIVMVRLPSLLGLYVALRSDRINKKFCVEVVGSAWGSYWYKSKLGKIVAYPLEIANRYIIRKAQFALYVTEDYLQKEYPTNGKSISCTDVILGKRTIDLLNARVKKIKNRENKKNLILGTLAQVDYRYKGQATVIQAIVEMKKKGVNIEYRLAGSGSKKHLYEIAKSYGVEENIIFYGPIKHSEIESWIDDIDIYIQPSLTEGMPRAVIEALYRGCPVIVSNAGGMYELVESCYTFKKGNKNSLINILNKIDNPKLLDMAKRNYWFSEKFSYNILMEKRKSFYKNIRMEFEDELV